MKWIILISCVVAAFGCAFTYVCLVSAWLKKKYGDEFFYENESNIHLEMDIGKK